jgi:ureidoacrylate peracid hydrolase
MTGSAMRSPNKQITLAAKPEPLILDPARSAVVVVGMQNDFGSEGGMENRWKVP